MEAATIVAVWETARRQHPVDRALTLLAAGFPGRSRDELARLAIGDRDRLLFQLREQLFGTRLPLQASCPACRESSEFEVAIRDLVLEPAAGPFTVEVDGAAIRFRLPASADVARALAIADREQARRALIEACVVDGPAPLGEAALAAVAAAMEANDPQAELWFSLSCTACGQDWRALLDIGELLYAELSAATRELLAEVHELAFAYKWREADILAMSATRRRLYLEMIGHG